MGIEPMKDQKNCQVIPKIGWGHTERPLVNEDVRATRSTLRELPWMVKKIHFRSKKSFAVLQPAVLQASRLVIGWRLCRIVRKGGRLGYEGHLTLDPHVTKHSLRDSNNLAVVVDGSKARLPEFALVRIPVPWNSERYRAELVEAVSVFARAPSVAKVCLD
jgi:hypothetical protein